MRYKVVLLFLGFIQLDSTRTQAFTTVNTVHRFKKNDKKKIRPPYPIVQTSVTTNQQLFFGLTPELYGFLIILNFSWGLYMNCNGNT